MPEIEYLAGASVTLRLVTWKTDPKDPGSFPTVTQAFFYNMTKKKLEV